MYTYPRCERKGLKGDSSKKLGFPVLLGEVLLEVGHNTPIIPSTMGEVSLRLSVTGEVIPLAP